MNFMKTIKGEFEKGNIKLLEEAPSGHQNKVLITFLEDDENEDYVLRTISLQQPASFMEYLQDEREDLYQDFLNDRK